MKKLFPNLFHCPAPQHHVGVVDDAPIEPPSLTSAYAIQFFSLVYAGSLQPFGSSLIGIT